MGLYERIKDIAKEKGYSINKLERELEFPRSSISKYNKNKPSIDKIRRIAEFLDVPTSAITGNDADVDFVRLFSGIDKNNPNFLPTRHLSYELSTDDDPTICEIIIETNKLNNRGRERILRYAKELICNPLFNCNYKTELNAAHERTDVDVTNDMKKHDDDIMNDDNF